MLALFKLIQNIKKINKYVFRNGELLFRILFKFNNLIYLIQFAIIFFLFIFISKNLIFKNGGEEENR